jgi:hypothetical protein
MPVVVVVRDPVAVPTGVPAMHCLQPAHKLRPINSTWQSNTILGVFAGIYIMAGIDRLEMLMILAGPVYRLISAVNPVKCYLLYSRSTCLSRRVSF